MLAGITVSIDHRERDLITLVDVPHVVKALDVGDVVCEYDEENMWIAERKRADDLAKCIKNGRWREQSQRLCATGCRKVFFLIEGDIRSTSLNHDSLLGACINAELRPWSHVIRTVDIEETASVIKHLIKKARHVPGMASAVLTAPISKRKRNADRQECWIRQLMCVPSISEGIARRLLDEFGTFQAIQKALSDYRNFKNIKLNDKTCIGKARLQKLSFYLGDNKETAEQRDVG